MARRPPRRIAIPNSFRRATRESGGRLQCRIIRAGRGSRRVRPGNPGCGLLPEPPELHLLRSRGLCFVVTAWYAAAALGLPLPAPPPAARVAGERFPCESCPCGCDSAEQCWTACCCHALSERLAWAKREGVRPPSAALAQARREGLEIEAWVAVRLERCAAPSAPRPSSPGETSCCAHRCAARNAPPRERPGRTPAVAERPARPGVSAFAALACRGLHGKWLSLGAATLAPSVELSWRPAASEVCLASARPLASPTLDVPTPPPRSGSAVSVRRSAAGDERGLRS